MSQHGKSCHSVNERSSLGIFTSRHAAEAASRREFGSTGVAWQSWDLLPCICCLPMHISLVLLPSHLTTTLVSVSWMENDAVPILTVSCWGGGSKEEWDEGKGQHSREEKDAGTADPWLTKGRDGNPHPCRGTSPGRKMLSKQAAGEAFVVVHERRLPCDTATLSPLQELSFSFLGV